jgi:hypothetical protein
MVTFLFAALLAILGLLCLTVLDGVVARGLIVELGSRRRLPSGRFTWRN